MKYKILLLISLISATLSKLSAQDNEATEPWSLRRCYEYALETNLSLKQAYLSQQSSDIDLKQSQHQRMPSLNGSGSFNRSFGRSINPVTNAFQNVIFNSGNYSLNSSITLFAGGRIANSIERDRLALEAAKYDVQDAENTLALDIAAAYLSILQNKELLESAELQRENTIEQRDRTAKLVNAGTLAKNSLIELDAQIATEQLNVVNAENTLALAYLNLQQILTLPPSESFEIVIPELPDPSDLPTESSEEVFQYAVSNQPNIRSAMLQIKSSEKGVTVAQAGRYPTLSLGGSLNTNVSSGRVRQIETGDPIEVVSDVQEVVINGERSNLQFVQQATPFELENVNFVDQFEENFGYGFGLSLNIPIYNRRQVQSNVDRAIIGVKQAQNNLAIQEQTLRQTIEQANLDAVSAYAAYNQGKSQLESLQLALDNAERQLQVGVINSVDYLVAKNNLARATFDVIRTKYIYIFRTKILDFYQGKPINLD